MPSIKGTGNGGDGSAGMLARVPCAPRRACEPGPACFRGTFGSASRLSSFARGSAHTGVRGSGFGFRVGVEASGHGVYGVVRV